MPSFRLTLAYDGTDFAGSQIQPDCRTVQGELAHALTQLGCSGSRILFAGRTDRGVHAIGQVAAAHDAQWHGSVSELERALEGMLPTDLAARDVVECDARFNPRFDASWREYRYWIAPGAAGPFVRRYAWTRRARLDVSAMAAGAARFVGKHNFAAFASGGEGVPWSERSSRPWGTTRTVFCCGCREAMVAFGPFAPHVVHAVEIRVIADGFLPRMVRNIAGALVEIGAERRDPEWISEVLAVADRRQNYIVAPPHGLTLWRVGIAEDPPVTR